MTTAAALHLLGLHPAATAEEIGRAYAQRRSELAASGARAPTPGLKAKYAQQTAELDNAFRIAMEALLHPQNLPFLQPVEISTSPTPPPAPPAPSPPSLPPSLPPVEIPVAPLPALVPSGEASAAGWKRPWILASSAVLLVAAAAAGGGWWMQSVNDRREAERREADRQRAEEEKRPGDPSRATKANPWTNSLGMKFVPVPGTTVVFCVHETRSRDFAAFRADPASGYTMTDDNWKTCKYGEVPVGRGASESADQSSHPVASVSWLDAVAFCEWLSKKEGNTYRLPTDREWSVAVGIPQEPEGTPNELDGGVEDEYPWGGNFDASSITGNYADSVAAAKLGLTPIADYTDGFATTAPVMSFTVNQHGLYDMGGNLWEWCGDCEHGTDSLGENKTLTSSRVLRGGSWNLNDQSYLLSSNRYYYDPGYRNYGSGFRVVVVAGSGG